jgi:hypothetical protein
MKNIDCEIYIKQLITFFENNPNDLIELIGKSQKKEFFDKLKDRCERNLLKGQDHVITRQQMVDIVIQLKMPELIDNEASIEKIEGSVQKTNWGDIYLN